MNRLTLLAFLALGLAGTASAQSTSTVSQTGTLHNASVSQTGAGHGTTITQTDTDNDATVIQTGTANETWIVQDDTGNDAFSTQSSTNNDAEIFQGTGNPILGFSTTGMSTANVATIDQSGAGNGGPGLGALVAQGTDAGTASGSSGWVTQTGTVSVGIVAQGIGNIGVATDVDGVISQASSNNRALIAQGLMGSATGDGTGTADATVTQTGTGGWADLWQGFGGGSTSIDNGALIEQSGADPWNGVIFQGVDQALNGAGTAEGNTAIVRMRGDGLLVLGSSDARVFQGVDGGNAQDNTANILQELGADDNMARINQGFGTGVMTDNSQATINQLSDSNAATINQIGSFHVGTVTQQ